MAHQPRYEVAVVGGGPAGKTTALYATRLGHDTALFDAAGGRHAAVTHVHNVIGISEETSGADFAEVATDQFVEYGGDFYDDAVEDVSAVGDEDASAVGDTGGPADDGDDAAPAASAGYPRFRLDAERATVTADRVVLATGFSDRPPRVPGLRRFTGRGLHYCLHCDAYSLGDGRVFVLGHDDHAAHVAMVLLNFTSEVELLLHGREPTWDDATATQVEAHPLTVVDREVAGAFAEDEEVEAPWLGGLEFADGSVTEYAGGFAVYGREYDNRLARELGCDCREDGAVAVDEYRRTSVDGVYAVGDLTHGQNQTPIAMGDGAYAGIALHKDLRRFPVPAAELDGELDASDAPAAATDLRARMRRLRERGTTAGMKPEKGRRDG